MSKVFKLYIVITILIIILFIWCCYHVHSGGGELTSMFIIVLPFLVLKLWSVYLMIK